MHLCIFRCGLHPLRIETIRCTEINFYDICGSKLSCAAQHGQWPRKKHSFWFLGNLKKKKKQMLIWLPPYWHKATRERVSSVISLANINWFFFYSAVVHLQSLSIRWHIQCCKKEWAPVKNAYTSLPYCRRFF